MYLHYDSSGHCSLNLQCPTPISVHWSALMTSFIKLWKTTHKTNCLVCNSKRSQEPSCIMISKSIWSVNSLHITHSNSQQPLWNQIPWNSRGVPLCADPKLFGEGLGFSGIVAHSCTMKWLRRFHQWLHTKWFRNSRAHCEMKSLPMNRVSLAHKRE